jgi:hypothetical protein
VYWGLYNPVERPTGNFGEEYFGGDSNDTLAVAAGVVVAAFLVPGGARADSARACG